MPTANGSAVPTVEDWSEWVSASAMRNHVDADPLLDWLDLHGEAHGFEPDEVDDRTDHAAFILRKGREFEHAVMSYLASLGLGEIRQILGDDATHEERLRDEHVEATLAAMSGRVPIVAQGALRDAASRTFGFPDLLVRSDVLASVFPDALQPGQAAVPAPSLGLETCHYLVVDIKFTTLHFNTKGGLLNSNSHPVHKVELFVYNRALGAMQGYTPPRAFLLGRGWELKQGGETTRVGDCMGRLAPVSNDEATPAGSLGDRAEAAADWLRRVRSEGYLWHVLPEPTVPELRPNAKGDHGNWAVEMRNIVAQSADLTRLWQVSAAKRALGIAAGFTRWTDPALTPADVGIKGKKQAPVLQALLEVNRGNGPPVQPEHINTERDEWSKPAAVEFYVDYETVNNENDDFSTIPLKGGQPLIFMIGCGHIENDAWQFECFTADNLSEPSEAAIIEQWFNHMATVTARLSPGATPTVFHWHSHEQTSLETAYNAAAARHSATAAAWPQPNWFDFLNRVVKAEPVVVRGSHAFGLKPITNALNDLGLIDVSWETGPTDGLDAMVGAWWCQDQIENGAAQKLADLGLMQEIQTYNEVDCQAMMEIIRYLRKNH